MSSLSSHEIEAEQIGIAIRASEDWAKGFDKAPEQHAALIKQEARLETRLRRYLRELAEERVVEYVNWLTYREKSIAAAEDPLVKVNVSGDMSEEVKILVSILYEGVLQTITLGAQAGEFEYSTPMGLTSLDEAIIREAQKYTETLAKGLTETTKKQIANSIETSIMMREDQELTIKRLRNVIKNAKRAELIAQTESVNAYNRGIIRFGKSSGAVRKEWEASPNACRICTPLDGEVVGIDELFSNGLDGPSAHPRCRCRVYLDYSE